MENIIVFSQRYNGTDKEFLTILLDALSDLKYTVHINEELADLIGGDFPMYDLAILKKGKNIDAKVMITLGGDGTILSATRWLNKNDIPIMGINLGRMGFLASIEKNTIKRAIQDWNNGNYKLENRTLIQLDSEPNVFSDFPYALNDFTILKKGSSAMITIHTYLDGEFLNSYWADGLIISTPTGSTGYSLSCGGPIVFPNSNNFVITPIAPHNLNVRPVVVPDSMELSFKLDGRMSEFLCSMDSRHETVSKDHELKIRKGDFNITMVVLTGESFMKTIRDKLSWGLDIRN